VDPHPDMGWASADIGCRRQGDSGVAWWNIVQVFVEVKNGL